MAATLASYAEPSGLAAAAGVAGAGYYYYFGDGGEGSTGEVTSLKLKMALTGSCCRRAARRQRCKASCTTRGLWRR